MDHCPLPSNPPQVLTTIICCLDYSNSFQTGPLQPFSSPQFIFPAGNPDLVCLESSNCFPPDWESYSIYLPWPTKWHDLPLPTLGLLLVFIFPQTHWLSFSSWNLRGEPASRSLLLHFSCSIFVPSFHPVSAQMAPLKRNNSDLDLIF